METEALACSTAEAPRREMASVVSIHDGPRHLMVDIETLGPTPNGALMQIGWCGFNLGGDERIMRAGEVTIDYADSNRHGGRISGDTLSWWLHPRQAEAWDTIYGVGAQPLQERDALVTFFREVRKWDYLTVWAKPPSFDFEIIRNRAERYNLDMPWYRRQEMDVRTLLKASSWVPPKKGDQGPHRKGTHHNAREDAVHQARQLQYAWRRIRG